MQDERVNIRSSAELLYRGLITNAWANVSVAVTGLLIAITQLFTALVILYVWGS